MTDTAGALVCLAPASTRCQRARHAAWGGSPVGGHGDVFSGGSPWTVTGPLLDLSCSLVMLKFDLYSTLCSSCFHTLCLVLLTLHRLVSPFHKLGRHVSGEALRVISVNPQTPTHEKGVDGHAYYSSTFVQLTPNLVLLTLHRLASHFYTLGRHASGDALRVDGQPPTHEKRVDGHAYYSPIFVRLTLWPACSGRVVC